MDDRKKLIEKIIDELNGRKGFDDWWHNICEDIQEEITETLVNILPIPVVVKSLPCGDCENYAEYDGALKICSNCGTIL